MKVVYRGASLRLPDFLIVGAARSGTTTLYSFLDRQPGIFMPREKEPMFFSVYGQDWSPIDVRTGEKTTYVVEDLAEYLRLFRGARDGQRIGEASTWYLYRYPAAIRNIREIYGDKSRDLKIIILLRNPADRAWSHYQMKIRDGEENLSFEQAIRPEVVRERSEKNFVPGFDYIGFGRYFRQVESYLESFPHVKILLFEEMVRDMVRARREVCEFLGVEVMHLEIEEERLNVTGTPKNRTARVLRNIVYRPGRLKSLVKALAPYKFRGRLKYRLSAKLFRPERMDGRLRNQLAEIYRDDILGLARLIDRDLGRWLGAASEEKS